jgi:hypothetical protein
MILVWVTFRRISERGLVGLPGLKGLSSQNTHIRRTPSRNSYRCSGGRSYGLCSLNRSSVSSMAVKPRVGSVAAAELRPQHDEARTMKSSKSHGKKQSAIWSCQWLLWVFSDKEEMCVDLPVKIMQHVLQI